MRLFSTCYTITKTPEEAAIAAKYDLLIVNQDAGASHLAWLNAVKTLKPTIKIIAYQIVSEEPGQAPGPGNTILMARSRWDAAQQEPWLMTASGDIAAFTVSGWKRKRMFDYRLPVWQSAFKDACAAVFATFPYDGMFFDNCTASWGKHQPANPSASQSLQSVLLDVRRMYPEKWFIGNGVENWLGLNGEMNEGRILDLNELIPVSGQIVPNVNCFSFPLTPTTTDAEIQSAYNLIKPYGAWFGAHRWDGVLHWPAVFNSIED